MKQRKRLLIIGTFLLIGLFVSLTFESSTVVRFKECHESACTDLRLKANGRFTLQWSIPLGAHSHTTDFFSGRYLVKKDEIYLYRDSIFDASQQVELLTALNDKKRINIFNAEFSSHFSWIGGYFPAEWHE